jgi:hypothetical protein
VIHSGSVREGRLVVDQPARLAAQLAKLEGKRVRVTVETPPTVRSLDANSYYWGVVIAYWSEWTGYDPKEMHGTLKAERLSEIRILPDGTEIEAKRSTSTLTTGEFSEYVDWCRRKAAEHGLYIPGPNEPPEVIR